MSNPIKEHILKIYGREPSTMDELAECIIAVINNEDNVDYFKKGKRKSKTEKIEVTGFSWDITHSKKVGNSHSSPYGYPQNWCSRDKTIPGGYPGWEGRLWIRYKKDPMSFGSDYFKNTLTHTGTGGAGGYGGPWEKIASVHYHRFGNDYGKNKEIAYPRPSLYSWHYKIFDFDWPLLYEYINGEEMWDTLNNRQKTYSHKFLWNDPETAKADASFIEECAKLGVKYNPYG